MALAGATAAPASRLRSWRRWIAPLVSPPTFDFWAQRLNRTLSWSRTLARIVEIRAESRDAVTLVLKPNGNFRGLQPGQHLDVSAEIDGMRVTRSYSPTAIARHGRLLSLTVKHIPGGRMSSLLCQRARVGDVLELGAAYGDFCLPDLVPEKLLLLAAGSGITPLMSQLRDLMARGMPSDVVLLYWARQQDELCFVRELRTLAAREPRLRVRFLLTREAPQKPDEAAGRIDRALLARKVPDLTQRAVYACGPGGFVARARELIALQARHFHAEAFTPPALQADASAAPIQVELRRSGRRLQVPAGVPLLGALEAQGLRPAYGCRIGICKTCVCEKRAGISQHLDSGHLHAEPEQALRLCVSVARSDLVLEL